MNYQCIKKSFYYILDKECVKDYKENEYKITSIKKDDEAIQNIE